MRLCVVDIDGDAASSVAETLGGIAVQCDVSDPEQVDAAFAACARELGSVDLAFLNAGITSAIDLGARLRRAVVDRRVAPRR